MALIVQKFGGTSVGSLERIEKVAERALATQRQGNRLVVVLSAMSGETNRLLGLSRELSSHPSAVEQDVLVSTGEQVTVALAAIAVQERGGQARSMTGWQAGIRTNTSYSRARIEDIDAQAIHAALAEGQIVFVAGFQGVDGQERITTLGRGGSDLTAIALAAALKADLCQIYTDVQGVYTCDPRIVPEAKKINELSYDEMLELASSGAKVMQARSVEFAHKHSVPFEVRSSLVDATGTLVTQEHESMEHVVVRGISLERDQAKVTLNFVPDEPGSAASVFQALGEAELNIDMIVQNVARDGTARISFTLHQDDLERAGEALAPVQQRFAGIEVESERGIAKLSAVGIGMRSHSGVAAQMFGALSEAGINIRMISTSEIKIAVTIDERDAEEAARAVHAAFALDR